MMKRGLHTKKAIAFAMAAALTIGSMQMKAFAYDEVMADNTTFRNETEANEAYQEWLKSVWSDGEKQFADTGKAALTPGKTEKDLNLAWYAPTAKTPAVQIWQEGQKSGAVVVKGTASEIAAENWQGNVYTAACKVSIEQYFTENTNYCYRYTDDYKEDGSSVWSDTYEYKTKAKEQFSVILTGDPQVGASDSKSDESINDISVSRDTFNWNLTMEQALKTCPNAAFLLSAGDQIDKSGAVSENNCKTRESEYAGYLYPSIFRSLPIAATIGNHDTAGVDYSNHFNNPNAEDGLGATAAGCDYYFSYGDVLFISLNSNNRNQDEHRTLLQKAVDSNKDAKWRVVILHSDIYGSGEPHADTDAATNRIVLAPLMDEFHIDVCFTGHDHTYSRSKIIYDGNVLGYDYTKNEVTNPEGTLYISTGSGSGSKYYNLLNYTPYFIAERTNDCLPAFSVVSFSEQALTIQTYDYTGKKYADDYTIKKTADNVSSDEVLRQAEEMLQSEDMDAYTEESVAAFKAAAEALKNFKMAGKTEADEMIAVIQKGFGTAEDVVKGYGSITFNEDKDTFTVDGKQMSANRFKAGKSTLLDKTIYTQLLEGKEIADADLPFVDVTELQSLCKAVLSAEEALMEKETEEQTPEEDQNAEDDQEQTPDSSDADPGIPLTGDSVPVLLFGALAASMLVIWITCKTVKKNN